MESTVINATMAEIDRMVPTMLASPDGFQALGLIGAPAMGKTMYFQTRFREHMANHYGVQTDDIGIVIEKIGQAEDAAAVNGLTLPSKLADGTIATVKSKPSILVRIEATGKEYGVLLLDEAAQAGTNVVGSLGDTFNRKEHKVGDWPLPEGWVVVFTGNRIEDKSGSRQFPFHLIAGRGIMVNLLQDSTGWVGWAKDAGVNPLFVGFIEAEYSNAGFANEVPKKYGPYLTPRSGVAAAAHLDAFMASDEFTGYGIPPHIVKLLAMNIGPSAASALEEHIKTADKVPSGEEIISDPEGAMVPDDTGFQQLAANRAMNVMMSEESMDAALRYIVRLRPDLQVSLGTKLIRRSVDEGWTMVSPLANAFLEKFSEFLPLATEEK
jgi:hypothetical protein